MVTFRSCAQDLYTNYKLQEARRSSGLSLEGLSRATGIGLSALSAYERLRCFPTEKNARRIAETLNMSPAELFPEDLHVIVPGIRYERSLRNKMELPDLSKNPTCEGDDVLMSVNRQLQIERVRCVLNLLPDKQRKFLERIYGLNGEEQVSQEQIANEEGVSKQAISQRRESLHARVVTLLYVVRIRGKYNSSVR